MLDDWENSDVAARWNLQHGWHSPIIGAINDRGWLRTMPMKIVRKMLFIVVLIGFCGIAISPANATTGTQHALEVIESSGGHYVWAAASPQAADCSGLVSVAQSIAMGEAPHRLGDTHTLLAGQWPHAIPGATPDDVFVIGVNSAHMVARIDGVNIESSGGPYRVGIDAASPFEPRFQQYHVDPLVIGA